MKMAGIEKPEAERLIGEKWSQMRNEEQIFWTEIQKKELGGVARRVESRPTAGVAGNTQVEIKPFSWSFDKMKYYRTGREDSWREKGGQLEVEVVMRVTSLSSTEKVF